MTISSTLKGLPLPPAVRMIFKTIAGHVQLWWAELNKKKKGYWITVALLLVLGTVAGEFLGQSDVWIRLRYWIYNKMPRMTAAKTDRKTVVVLISDDDYWKGSLARRVPLNRDYLASLIEKVSDAEPNIIALDVDLRSPIPQQSSAELEAYRGETKNLLDTIEKISAKRPIVLATTVTYDGTGYVLNPNIFDERNFNKEKVLHGYTMLRPDLRQVPLSIAVKNRPEPENREDSFASAIARIRRAEVVTAIEHYEELPYGHFFDRNVFDKVTAGQVFNMDEKVRKKLQGQIVIIGGAWHTQSYKGGDDITIDSVDVHFTPVGLMQGAYVHANYVEALLTGDVRPQLSHTLAVIMEIFFSLMVAVSFAMGGSQFVKIGRVAVVFGVVVLLSYFLWQNLGLFFDFFIPLVLLTAHVPIEQYRETAADLRAANEEVLQLKKQLQQLKAREPVPEPVIEKGVKAVASTN